MRAYFKIESDLKELVNSGRSKKGEKKGEKFKALLTEFKTDYKKELSTFFIKNLMDSINDNRKKTHKLAYLLRLANLKTKRLNYYFDSWGNQQYQTDIIDYKHNTKNKIYSDECVLTEQEEKQLNELNQIEEKTGISLFN